MDSPEPFDPFTQSFTLLLADGTPFSLSLSDVDDFVLYHVQISINFAAQLGASCILLLALLVLTKPDKRRSPVFILNALALILNVIRNVLQCLYYTGHFSEVYAYFGQDYSRVPTSEYATSIAASVFALLVLICIEASLILQIRVVCFLVAKSYRQAIFTLSAIIALLAIGFRLALCVQNSRFILTLKPPTSLQWLESASDITRSISICWFCAVFITKLGFALHERRQLGIKRFGPMQIIFIMGCQTMIVPAIFTLLQYFTPIPAMSSNALTAVVLFLPLSALWASKSVYSHSDEQHDTMVDRRRRRRSFFDRFQIIKSGGSPSLNEKILDSPSSATVTHPSKIDRLSSPVKADRTDSSHDLEQGSGEKL